MIEEKKKGLVYPPGIDNFNAFNMTPLSQVKVVIFDQDRNYGPGQAHVLYFSVKRGITSS